MASVCNIAGDVLYVGTGTFQEILDLLRANLTEDVDVVLLSSTGEKICDPTDFLIYGDSFQQNLQEDATAVYVRCLTDDQRDLIMQLNPVRKYMPRLALNDREVVHESLEVSGDIFTAASERLRDDFELAKKALGLWPFVFERLSLRLRTMPELVELAINTDPFAFKHIGEECKQQKHLCQASMERILEIEADMHQRSPLFVTERIRKRILDDLRLAQEEVQDALDACEMPRRKRFRSTGRNCAVVPCR